VEKQTSPVKAPGFRRGSAFALARNGWKVAAIG
jgi:hypothetical protein